MMARVALVSLTQSVDFIYPAGIRSEKIKPNARELKYNTIMEREKKTRLVPAPAMMKT